MPLSLLKQSDRLIWFGYKSGCFSVRSAYHLEMHRRAQLLRESWRLGEKHGLWKLLWQIEAPAVLKNFAWKVGNNLLPTKANLVSKHIEKDSQCPLCLSNDETICHILWECPSSVAVWQECSRWIQKLALEPCEGMDLLQQFISKLDVEELVEVFTMASDKRRMLYIQAP